MMNCRWQKFNTYNLLQEWRKISTNFSRYVNACNGLY